MNNKCSILYMNGNQTIKDNNKIDVNNTHNSFIVPGPIQKKEKKNVICNHISCIPGKGVKSNGEHSLAQGRNTISNGKHSISSGEFSISQGRNSFSGGLWTEAKQKQSVAFGEYSVADNLNEFCIGSKKGSEDGRITQSQHIILPLSISISGSGNTAISSTSYIMPNHSSFSGKIEIVGKSHYNSNSWGCILDALIVNDGDYIYSNITSFYEPKIIGRGLETTKVAFGDDGAVGDNSRSFEIQVDAGEPSGFGITFIGTQLISTGNIKGIV